ncbi:MAG TPA: hypothetical protein VM597_03080, partial [Gemmataceae bacterium]|nr:hypothetical protein [Gemmataceae bacterium]
NKITVSAMGMDNVMPEATKSKYVFTDEILARPADARRPTKIKRTYETAERTKNGAAVDLGLAGKTVMIEKKADKYEFAFADGSALGEAAAEVLNKEINDKSDVADEIFAPKKPVKVGETWAADLAVAAKDLEKSGLSIDVAKSKATVKLTKVYDKDGAKFGSMEVKMEFIVTKASGRGQEIPMKDGSKLVIEGTMDGCIDGTSPSGVSQVKMTGDMAAELMGAALKFDLSGTKSTTSESLRKRK